MAEPKTMLADLRRLGDGAIYDALTGRMTTQDRLHLWDPVGVLREALEAGTSGGMMALTVSALVLHRKPQESLEP
jgi:hypothetical protein